MSNRNGLDDFRKGKNGLHWTEPSKVRSAALRGGGHGQNNNLASASREGFARMQMKKGHLGLGEPHMNTRDTHFIQKRLSRSTANNESSYSAFLSSERSKKLQLTEEENRKVGSTYHCIRQSRLNKNAERRNRERDHFRKFEKETAKMHALGGDARTTSSMIGHLLTQGQGSKSSVSGNNNNNNNSNVNNKFKSTSKSSIPFPNNDNNSCSPCGKNNSNSSVKPLSKSVTVDKEHQKEKSAGGGNNLGTVEVKASTSAHDVYQKLKEERSQNCAEFESIRNYARNNPQKRIVRGRPDYKPKGTNDLIAPLSSKKFYGETTCQKSYKPYTNSSYLPAARVRPIWADRVVTSVGSGHWYLPFNHDGNIPTEYKIKHITQEDVEQQQQTHRRHIVNKRKQYLFKTEYQNQFTGEHQRNLDQVNKEIGQS